ncbi:MAG: hypothetical protein A2958_00800 [Candidatus Levybacteria bacterium RIFCSPLOWO2_01_FULL_38_13]|nr:MAG: hypothetical protein A2629_00695 [Candidatus Levybacteria bacterium RIFCSPHIGHO2_01_FULL_41_15]OGH34826.1 MAG: hypothetical protein A2958_00800 [Candidatus Levybacteria bacterium RIFCSPLOWO2_01_FULL_38_13]
MDEENKIQQGFPVPKPNLSDRIVVFLNTKKIIAGLAVIVLVLFIIVPFIFFRQSKKIKQTPKFSPVPAANPSIQAPSPKSIPTITLPPEDTYVSDQLIIKYKPGQSPDELQDQTKLREIELADKEAGVLSKEKLYKDTTDNNLRTYYLIKLKTGSDLLQAITILKNLSEVDNVETNAIVQPF